MTILFRYKTYWYSKSRTFSDWLPSLVISSVRAKKLVSVDDAPSAPLRSASGGRLISSYAYGFRFDGKFIWWGLDRKIQSLKPTSLSHQRVINDTLCTFGSCALLPENHEKSDEKWSILANKWISYHIKSVFKNIKLFWNYTYKLYENNSKNFHQKRHSNFENVQDFQLKIWGDHSETRICVFFFEISCKHLID